MGGKSFFDNVDILCSSDQTLHESYYNVTGVRLFIAPDVKDSCRANRFKKKALTANVKCGIN